jgi:hypothetical protein
VTQIRLLSWQALPSEALSSSSSSAVSSSAVYGNEEDGHAARVYVWRPDQSKIVTRPIRHRQPQ